MAPDMVRFTISHALTFAENGDLVVPAISYIARVDCTTGDVVWKTPRTNPNTGAESLCVYGDRVYGFEGAINTPKTLVAYDLATGDKLYESATLPLNWDLFTGFIVLAANGPFFPNFLGTLDGTGNASAQFDTLGPLPQGSEAFSLVFAYALNAPWDFASNPVMVDIIP
jgi:hypothetical protein